MPQRVDELGGEGHKAGEVVLQGCVDVVILVRRDLKLLLELQGSLAMTRARAATFNQAKS